MAAPTSVLVNYPAARQFYLSRCKAAFKYVRVFIFSFMVFPLKSAAVIQGSRGEWGRTACDVNHS